MSTLTETASQVRRDIVRMVHGVQSGHPGGSLGCADYLTALYFDIMKHNPRPQGLSKRRIVGFQSQQRTGIRMGLHHRTGSRPRP